MFNEMLHIEKMLKKFVFLMGAIGLVRSVSVIVSRPPLKYMAEGASGTIAACYRSTTDMSTGEESLALILGNIRWHWVNTTTSIPLPTSNTQSVWSNGFILSGANVKLQHSGKYCCVVGDAGSCTENATTQLIVTAPPKLTISEPVVIATQGSSARLTCNFVTSATIPIRVQWYQNNALLFAGEKISLISTQQNHSYTLLLHNLTSDDQGEYNCIADSNLNIPKTVGVVSLIVVPMPLETNPNKTRNHTDTSIDDSISSQQQNRSVITTLLIFPDGTECLNIDSDGLDSELQKSITTICECTNFSVTKISLQCINSSHATYIFLAIGPEAFAAAAALNRSISNDEYFTTESGTQFRPHPSSNSTTTIKSTSCDENDMLLAIFISAIVICLVIGGLLGALSVLLWKHKSQTDSDSKENLDPKYQGTNAQTSTQKAVYYSTTV